LSQVTANSVTRLENLAVSLKLVGCTNCPRVSQKVEVSVPENAVRRLDRADVDLRLNVALPGADWWCAEGAVAKPTGDVSSLHIKVEVHGVIKGPPASRKLIRRKFWFDGVLKAVVTSDDFRSVQGQAI
jgi:hypothetical protein